MTYSHRFFLYAPLALLLLVGAVVGAHWWSAATALGRRLDAMRTHEAMPGVTIGYAARSLAGFPFNLDAVFDDFRIAVATPHGPVVWRAEHFALHALTYGRDETIFEAAGRQALSWGRDRRLAFEVGSLHASAILADGALSRFDLDLVAFGSRALTAQRLQLHLRRNAGVLDVAASGEELRLSPSFRGALGETLHSVALQGEVSSPRTFDGLRAGRVDWRSAVEAWRAAQGSFRLAPLEIVSDTLQMTGTGNVELDEARRPAGLIDFKVAGMPDWLRRDAQGAFADALRGRAAKAGDNESGKMGVVLGARDGIAYLGDAPVGLVEPLY